MDDTAQTKISFGIVAAVTFLTSWAYLHLTHAGLDALLTEKGLLGAGVGLIAAPLTLGALSYGAMRAAMPLVSIFAGPITVHWLGLLLVLSLLWLGYAATECGFRWYYDMELGSSAWPAAWLRTLDLPNLLPPLPRP